MRIGLAMARRVSALVTVTAASSGSCPSLEFVSFIVEDSFPSPPIIYKFLYKIFAFEWVRNMCLTGNAAIYCSCEKCLFWNEKQTTGEFICARLSMIRL